MNPTYPSRIDGDSLVGSLKSLQEFSAQRKTYPDSIVSRIADKNLFRKIRVGYKEEIPVAQVAVIPSLPPPEVQVKGIMLLKETRIAVMEGNYSIFSGGTSITKKNIKKKGYHLGDYVGDYQITQIDKNTVTMANKNGHILTVKLNRASSSSSIIHTKNGLYHSTRKPVPPGQDPAPATPTESSAPPEPASAPPKPASAPGPGPVQAKPAMTQASSTTHISGIPQTAAPRAAASISGAKTVPSKTKRHISGR